MEKVKKKKEKQRPSYASSAVEKKTTTVYSRVFQGRRKATRQGRRRVGPRGL